MMERRSKEQSVSLVGFSPQRPGGPRRAGFTVPEMLAVIAIILIIISLLLPNLNSSREVARRAICLSQLHQMMVGARGYMNENHGILPAMRESQTINGVEKQYTFAERLVLFNQVSAFEIFYCPAQDPMEYVKNGVAPFFHGNVRLDYGVNHYGRSNGNKNKYFDTLGRSNGNDNGTLRPMQVANQDAVCYSDADGDQSPWDIGAVVRGQKVWPLRASFETHAYKRHLNGYNSVALDTSATWRSSVNPVNPWEPWQLEKN